MLRYRDVLEYNKKCCKEYLEKIYEANRALYRQKSKTVIEAIDKEELISEDKVINKNKRLSDEAVSGVLSKENIDANINREGTKSSIIPGTIRGLLKMFICRRVVIVLNAKQSPQKVKIRDIVGDILVAETVTGTEDKSIKFIDIKCICEIIISHKELLESILSC